MANIILKKLTAFVLSFNMLFLGVPVSVLASEISGVTPTGNVYNIEAQKFSGQTQFRHYDKFNLSQGDIANLMFKEGYKNFVNLVNNQININGLVNTMRGSNFYNGHAIFVSPNGIVIGASGVLNVGSLTLLTPSQNSYNSFLNSYNSDTLSDYEVGKNSYNALITDSHGNIVVNGRILARDEVNLYGDDITIKGTAQNQAGIIAGWHDTAEILTTDTRAKEVFDSLVSNNIKDATNFALKNGKIKIVAAKTSSAGDSVDNLEEKVNIQNSVLGANNIDISVTAKVNRLDKVDLASAKIDIQNSYITGDTVFIIANAIQNKQYDLVSTEGIDDIILNIFSGNNPSIPSHWGVAGKAEAEVNVKESIVTALKATAADATENPNTSILIQAIASSSTSENSNFLTPTLINFIKDDDAHISEFFSSGTYDKFEGARSSAIVNIEKSSINATGANAKDVVIMADATSSLSTDQRLLAFFMPVGMFGVGTETVSKAIIKDSVLNATSGDAYITALSTNENSITISNDSVLSLKIEDAYLGMLVNNTVKTETEASIISSTVDTKNLTLLATNLTDNSADIAMSAIAGLKDEGTSEETHGNSAVSVVALMNRSDNKVSALIKDSTVNVDEDVNVIAQSLNITSNSADATIIDTQVKIPATFDNKFKKFIKNASLKYLNHNLFNLVRGKTSVVATESPTLEAGGVAVWNETNNSAIAKIENSNIKSKDVTVQANTVDLLSNSATTDSQGEGKYGIGLAFVYNVQNNKTEALIDSSNINADNVVVDATTELPMNQGKLTFGLNLPFKIFGLEKIQFGAKFSSEANGKWDVSGVYPSASNEEGTPNFELTGLVEQNVTSSYSGLKPKVRFSGLFNNIAQSNTVGSNAAVSGSIVYNEVVNNTTAAVQNGSDISINNGGKLIVNAVNSVMGYNGVGLFDLLIKQINYKIPGQSDWKYEPSVDGGKFGLGVNLAWDNYKNNATAKIDNSSVKAENGSVDVNAASEQSYLSAVMTGAKSEAFGLDGSIHVQNIKGDTIAQISNISGNDKIKAKDVSVNAGKANIKTTAGNIKRDSNTNLAKWKVQNADAEGDAKYTRDASDSITNIVLQGAWTSQYTESDNAVQGDSKGVAVGASVNVTNVDRTVKAVVDNAIIDAENNLFVNSDTYNQKIDVEVAAAFSGGVTQKASEVQNVQQNVNDAQDVEDNIFGNLFDGEDEYMRNPVGNAVGDLQSQFSMSLAGAVDVTTDSTKAEAEIKNSSVTTGNNLTVNANRETKVINFNGGLGQSKKVGAGAAVNVYQQTGCVKSYIDNSTLDFKNSTPDLNVLATNKNWLLNIDIGAGAATNSESESNGFKAAVGGSAAINTIKPTIDSYINNSSIKMADNHAGKINTTLNAKSDIDIINISGGGSYMKGGTSGLSAGAAFNYSNIKNKISSYIQNSTLNNINKLVILADADNNISGYAVAGSIVAGTDGSAFSFAGGADVDYIHDTITSKVINSKIYADDDVEVIANSNTDNLAVAGTFDISSAKSGVGVSGNVVVNVYRNDITSEVDSNSKILKAKDVKIAATSVEKSNVIPVGVALSSENSMAAANVGVNVIDNTVKAYLSGIVGDDAKSVKNVDVAAYDETTLYSRGGTLATASAESNLSFAGSINVDVVDKTVEAKIKDANIKISGDVTATATSINSMGGTKGSDNKYSRDDVTTDAYKDKMLNKNSDGEYVGLKQDNDFTNWNMFYDFALGANISVGGAAIIKTIQNTVTAELYNSDVKANNLSILATDYSIKNIIAGAISASGKSSVGLQTLVTYDRSTTSALITNSKTLDISNKIDIEAINRKDNHQIMIAAGGAGKFALNANVIVNDITDKAIAKIDNLSSNDPVKSAELKLNADENMNASHIIVSGSGAGNVALAVSPLINNYDGTVEASVLNATILNAQIDMNAQSNIETLDISVGVAGAGQGLAGVGIGIKNNYTNTVKSFIDNSVIDTSKNIFIDANSIIKSNNWIASIAGVVEGASLVIDVVLNNILSNVEAGIKNSNVEHANSITINTNKDKKDTIKNTAIGLAITGIGGSALTNTIQNIYNNTVTSYVDNTSVENATSLTVNSYSDRDLYNKNIGVSFAAEGASLLVDVLVNQIDSTTHSYVNAKSKQMNIANALKVLSNDKTEADNAMGMVSGAGLGVAIGANINLYYANNLAKAEVLSNSDGQIKAGTSDINSTLTNGLQNLNVGISGGIGSIAGDVAVIKLGKRTTTYSQSEQDSKIHDAINTVKEQYDKITENDKIKNKFTPTTSASGIQTGSIARVNGNLKTNNSTITAMSKLKGFGNNERLEITNTNISGGLAAAGVGVKNIQLANNTLAEISGGKVESDNGNIDINAQNISKVDITNVKVEASGIKYSGGSAIYNNTSETVAKIADATVNGNNINVLSNSTSDSVISVTNVVVTGANIVSVDLVENKDTNKNVSLITGNTNIDAKGKLTLHSTTNTNLLSTKNTVSVSGINLVDVSKNEVRANTISKAVIENINGTITTNGLDIITDYGTMKAYSKSNITSVKLGDIASIDSSGAYMEAEFKSGIDSLNELMIINSGDTNITTAKNTGTEGIVAKGEIQNVHASLIGFVASTNAKAENKATSTTVLKVKEHQANNLNINSNLNSSAVTDAGATKGTISIGANVVSVESKDTSILNVVIAGKNTILQNAIVNATHNSKVSSDLSAFNFSLLGGGSKIRLTADLAADTVGTIGGDFNANSSVFNFNTTRETVLSKSSGDGAGLVSISDSKVTNYLTGSSILNIEDFHSNKNGVNNKVTFNNNSTNTMDMTSSDRSGSGLIAVSQANTNTRFNTSTETNVINSNINSQKDVSFNLSNNSVVQDSAKMSAGSIFVTVADNVVSNRYISSAILSLKDSVITAKNINAQTLSDIRTAGDKIVDYVGSAGGFIASSQMNLTNNLIQTSTIDIENSQLKATKDINITAKTESNFKQRISTSAGGFVAIPKNNNNLKVENNNNINIGSNSKILASNELDINLESSNNLTVHSESKASHFGFKDPEANSYLDLTVNNNLKNNGSIEAGQFVNIDFMENSFNYLTQYAYSEAQAAIPTTSEDGYIKNNIYNSLTVSSGANIISGKDVLLNYSSGYVYSSSTIAYKSVCRVIFGIPITTSGSKSNYNFNHRATLKLDGEIVSGKGNNKYMKINRDGTIDSTTTGFYDSDYTLLNGETMTPEQMKEQALASLRIDLGEVEGYITEIESSLTSVSDNITSITTEISDNQAVLDMLNQMISNGYDFKTDDDIQALISNNVKSQVVLADGETNSSKISLDLYNNIQSAYSNLCAQIAERNNQKYADNPSATNFETVPDIVEFIGNNYSQVTEDQKTTFVNAYNSENSKLTTTADGKFQVYDNKYIITNLPTDESGQEITPIKTYETTITELNEKLELYNNIKLGYDKDLSVLNEKKADIEKAITDTENTDYSEQDSDYAILFNPLSLAGSSIIKLTGIQNYNISGSGNFKTSKSGLRIDNYSNRSVYFDNLIFGGVASGGLIISGNSHSIFADKPQAVSGAEAFYYLMGLGQVSFDSLPTSGVHYVSNERGLADVGITINNYYDTSNPCVAGTKVSNIVFFGDISVKDFDLNVWNESGSILVCDANIVASNIRMYATQNDVIFMLFDSEYKLNLSAGSEIFAGGSFNIMSFADTNLNNAKIVVDGSIKAGYGNRSITITDDMLTNLIEDPTTGDVNMINLGGSNISPYLNATNNIKALYKDGKIILFNTGLSATGGNVLINANVSGNGTITYTKGSSSITIDNQTTKELVVNKLDNYNLNGSTISQIDNLRIINQGLTNGLTEIKSNGSVSVTKGILTQSGSTTILSNAVYSQTGDITNTGGNLSITSGAGATIADNLINTGGNLSITSGAGATIDGNLINEGGNLSVVNNSGTLTINSVKVENNKDVADTTGNIVITQLGTYLLKLSSNIFNQNGSTEISSNGGLTQNSGIVNKNGNLNISSTGAMTLSDEILNTGGNLSIISGAGATIGGNLINEGGNLSVVNNSGTLTINSVKVENNKDVADTTGNIVITQLGTYLLKLSSNIFNQNGSTEISSNGGLIQSNIITNNGGLMNITVSENNGNNGTVINGIISNHKGDMSIVNNGNNGTVINGTISNYKGDMKIENKKGELTVSSSGVIQLNRNTSNVMLLSDDGENDLVMIQEGEGLFSIYGEVYNQKGDMILTANNSSSGINVGITLNDNGSAVNSKGTVYNNDGILKISNNGSQGISVLGTVTSLSGGIVNNTNSIIDIQRKVVSDDTIVQGRMKFGGNSIIINDGSNGINIDGDINNVGGQLEIINSDGAIVIGKLVTGTGVIEGNITNDYTIDPSSVEDDKNISIKISNTGNKGIKILGKITNLNEGDIVIENTNGGLIETTKDAYIKNNNGSISITNSESGGMILMGDIETCVAGTISIYNKGENNGILKITNESYILSNTGDISIINEGLDGIEIGADIASTSGLIDIRNNNTSSALVITSDSEIVNKDSKISLYNVGAGDMKLYGQIFDENNDILITNINSNIVIGEINSTNDNYIYSKNKDIIITQVNGSILNGIFDTDPKKTHYNLDLGNPDSAYKTLLKTGGDLTITVTDGDIGASSLDTHISSINATSRDFTDSINVNVQGEIVATAKNNTKTDNRLINLRAKTSDMKIKKIESDGGVILTAVDWRQPDARPVPKDDEGYFKGYSIINCAEDGIAVIAKDLSMIASDNIGSSDTPFIYKQTDSSSLPTLNIEAENLLNYKVNSDSGVTVCIGRLISKRGDVEVIFDADAVISELSAGKHLHVLQKAKNLTIESIGAINSSADEFIDILYPHDNIGGNGFISVPETISIEVLDALNGGSVANSTLNIYTAYVKGANSGKGAVDINGNRIADVKLMADNVYINSYKAPNSSVAGNYTPVNARGLNTYGSGNKIAIDVKGVSEEFVQENIVDFNRSNYNIQEPKKNIPANFANPNNQIQDYDYKVNNAIISVNNKNTGNRGVYFTSLYADRAFVDTKNTDLIVKDGYITKYAEFRNGNGLNAYKYMTAIDNGKRKYLIGNATYQLFTAKTGSFFMDMDKTIILKTTAPIVHFEQHKLVNTYNSEHSIFNLAFKENKVQQNNKLNAFLLKNTSPMDMKFTSLSFDTSCDKDLKSNVVIYNLSAQGAIIRNDLKLKKGKTTDIILKFDDVDVSIKAKVVNVENDKAKLVFIDIPQEVSNKILYRYMQRANLSGKDLTAL